MKFELQPWELSGLLNNASLFSIPDFQREGEIWSLSKKRLFIDTIIKGWKVPKLYLNNPEGSNVYEIVDGQQRIYTILAFLQNNFKISLADQTPKNFKELDKSIRDAILSYKLDVEIIHDAGYEEVANLFSRLQEGVALNSAEKLNAMPGKLSDFVKTVSEHRFFEKTGFRRRRYGLMNACQQICALEIEGIRSVKYNDLKEVFAANKDFDTPEVKSHILSILDFLDSVFETSEEYLSRLGNFVSIYQLSSWIKKNDVEYKAIRLYKFLNDFFVDFDKKSLVDNDFILYNLALIQSTSGEGSIKKRYEIIKKHLCLFSPDFVRFLDSDGKREFKFSIDQSLFEKSEQIQALIKEINERAIGLGRQIVFNSTAQTSHVFLLLPHTVTDYASYKTLIESLWKAFYEGSQSANRIGDLNADRTHSNPINDLNILIKIDDLRKVEEHDLEQDRATYADKIKTACEIRKLYTGKMHVNDFNESDFVIFQYKIVQELLDFLDKYRNNLRSAERH